MHCIEMILHSLWNAVTADMENYTVILRSKGKAKSLRKREIKICTKYGVGGGGRKGTFVDNSASYWFL